MTPNLAYYTNPGTYDQLTWGAGKSLNPNRHAGARNRSENQSTLLSAPRKPLRADESCDKSDRFDTPFLPGTYAGGVVTDPMTLRGTTAHAIDAACEHAIAALFAIDASDTPGRWWIEGQGVSTADYRVRLVPDPQPGEPNPWASPWSPT